MWCSKTLLKVDNSKIGRQVVGLEWLFNLGTGTTFASFHADGKQAELIDMLKRFVTDGAILEATVFNILAEIPSGPLVFVVSSLFKSHSTSLTVHKKSSGHSTIECNSSRIERVKGRLGVVKTFPKELVRHTSFFSTTRSY